MINDRLKKLIQDFRLIKSHIPISQKKLFIYFSGGIEFEDNTTLKDFVEIIKPEKLHIFMLSFLWVFQPMPMKNLSYLLIKINFPIDNKRHYR